MAELKCPHCGTPIDEHEATRCLDAWIAQSVLGIPVRFEAIASGPLWVESEWAGKVPLEAYSSDIAAAWHVVEKAYIHTIRIVVSAKDDSPAEWQAEGHVLSTTWGLAETMPLAVCRAALKAKEWPPIT